ncbi:MAG: TetR/AcrR family transcriptional regulator [Gammaproteobacteria bacterium]|nr:TetR/AcrR family transcriptional regulator [Gammaproteobacteria bacterium]
MTAAALTTAERILAVGQEMLQQRGFHAFSFRDIAARIDIRTASIHYYYPTKADLAAALLERVRGQFEGALQQFDTSLPDQPVERLRRFARIFLDTFGDGDRLCPFCMVATGQDSIPEPARAEVLAFWQRGEAWLTGTLEQGAAQGSMSLAAPPADVAATVIAGLEGAMVTARAFGSRERLVSAADYLIATLLAPGVTARSVAAELGEADSD